MLADMISEQWSSLRSLGIISGGVLSFILFIMVLFQVLLVGLPDFGFFFFLQPFCSIGVDWYTSQLLSWCGIQSFICNVLAVPRTLSCRIDEYQCKRIYFGWIFCLSFFTTSQNLYISKLQIFVFAINHCRFDTILPNYYYVFLFSSHLDFDCLTLK